ncbi:hypothetical protein SGLAM104S_00780 [Streptomyces glaucescens]
MEPSTTSYAPSRPYSFMTLLLSRPIIPALGSMPTILPPNSPACFFRSSREFTSFMYAGTVSSSEVGPYHLPRSSS